MNRCTLTTRRRAARRSKRVPLHIPVHVHGRTAEGHPFVEETLVTDISKHGAKILSQTALGIDQEVELENRLRHKRIARFRVVWIGRVKPDGSRELGLSYVGDPVPTVFGIFFP